MNSKTLFLVRHAKSSWKDASLPDHDRPLNKRGQRDAPVMGRRLARRGVGPEKIVSSSAARALSTAGIIAGELGLGDEQLRINPRIYGASADALLTVVHGLDKSVLRIMLVGHNPGLTEFVNALTGYDIDNVPTCGICVVRLGSVCWKEVDFGSGELVEFDFPKKPD
ncbi:MAG: histidine phosphatase family protein [Planctomycetaceae bacterium]